MHALEDNPLNDGTINSIIEVLVPLWSSDEKTWSKFHDRLVEKRNQFVLNNSVNQEELKKRLLSMTANTEEAKQEAEAVVDQPYLNRWLKTV